MTYSLAFFIQTNWLEDVDVQDVAVGPTRIVVALVKFLRTAGFMRICQRHQSDRGRLKVGEALVHVNAQCGPRVHIHRGYASMTKVDEGHQPIAPAFHCRNCVILIEIRNSRFHSRKHVRKRSLKIVDSCRNLFGDNNNNGKE
jgi:hypothetical protein